MVAAGLVAIGARTSAAGEVMGVPPIQRLCGGPSTRGAASFLDRTGLLTGQADSVRLLVKAEAKPPNVFFPLLKILLTYLFLLESFTTFLFVYFWPCHVACEGMWDLVSWTRLNPNHLHWERRVLLSWTARRSLFLNDSSLSNSSGDIYQTFIRCQELC